MKDDCEIDAREKFELGILNPRLSGLWMSKYGYTLSNQNIDKQKSVTVNFVRASDTLESKESKIS